MKTFLKGLFFPLVFAGFLIFGAHSAFAATPFLSATSQGNGSVQISITNANAFSRIDLSYRPQGTSLWTQVGNIGTTDQIGNFNQTVNVGSSSSGSLDMFVTVGGLQSSTITVAPGYGGTGCYYPYNTNCNNNGSISLSQNNINLASGQSTSVTVYGATGSFYVASNSNSGVVSASVSGNTVNLYGYSSGSTTISICGYNASGCASLYVTVNGNSGCSYSGCNSGSISFSQSNVNVNVGQTTSVSVYGSGAYYISGNTNSSVVNATVSGSTINLYGYSNGSASISVCSSGSSYNYGSQCGTLYVTVGGNNGNGNQVTFSVNNLNLNVGQSQSVTMYGGNNSFYVSSNTNSSVVSATVSGSNLSLYGNSIGSSTISVCSSGYTYQCGTLYVTVGGNNGNQQITFSQNSISLASGQSQSVTIFGGNGNNYFVSSNSNSSVVSANISSNVITLIGNSFGSASIIVCSQNNSSACGTLYVTVGSSGGNQLTFSQTSVSLNFGQSSTVNIYGGTGNSFYISSNTNPSAVSATISGSSVYLVANTSGSATITVCNSGSGQCGSFFVTTGNGSGSNQLTFSPSSVTVSAGQSQSVTVFGGTSFNYYISSNSNPSIAGASISGGTITVTGISSGQSTLIVCNSGYNQCGTLSVFVNGFGGTGQVWFSQTNVNVNVGQSLSVPIYSNTTTGGYFISTNTNNGAVSATLSGTNLNIYGVTGGSATITVCVSSTNQCGSVFVTVGGYGQTITFSQSSVSVGSGQTVSVSIYGGFSNNYYISNNSNSSVVSASLSGSSLNLYGLSNGTATLTVCAGSTSQCGSLFVSVVGTTQGGLTFQTTSLPQPQINQSYNQQLIVAGGNFPYTFVLSSGNLPNGLSLTSDGRIIGTPTTTGTFTFQVRATDILSHTGFGNLTLTPFGGSNSNPGGTGLQLPPGSVQGASTLANGTLISDAGTIYIVYKNTKTGFANYAAFTGLGFKISNVLYGDTSSFADSGYIIKTAQAQHPWGSWIKQGSTIYFVHESGLIPISSYNVFLSNGGNMALVVNANAYDLALPRLPIMVAGDSRLQ